jgi:pyruvate/2-oxoglutarate dehydrogenase complex dihydrolipoamide acyltransferase (E2) component
MSSLFGAPLPGFAEKPWPPLRNAVLAALEQARPHTCWGFGEVDVTDTLAKIKACQRELRMAVSLHAVVLHALARASAAHPAVLTFRHRNKLVTFTDVDVCTMIDRRFNGHRIAAAYCVRAAQTKSLAQLSWELRAAINQPVPNDPAIHLRRRVARLPGFVRRVLNGMVMRNPHLVRKLYGTIGLTNLQSHGFNRPFWGLPPIVMTAALSMGTVVDRVALDASGRAVNRKHLCLVGAADHAVIDGMALSRFAYDLVQLLERGAALDDAFVAEMRQLAARDSIGPGAADAAAPAAELAGT